MIIKCTQCGKDFNRKPSQILKFKIHFCSKVCYNAFNKTKTVSIACKNCGNFFEKYEKYCKEHSNDFCCRSCAAIYNNKHFPKRRMFKENFCIACGEIIPKRRSYCDACNPNLRDWAKTTIEDLKKIKSTGINQNAKAVYLRSGKPRVCINCGYDKHYNVCHIKPIHQFASDTPVSVVNNIGNLVALCPNCHWELDNGILALNDLFG